MHKIAADLGSSPAKFEISVLTAIARRAKGSELVMLTHIIAMQMSEAISIRFGHRSKVVTVSMLVTQ